MISGRRSAAPRGRPGCRQRRRVALADYDFRHARLTYLASNTQNLTGAAFLAGHRHVSTTALYVHPNEAAAREVLDAVSGHDRDGEPAGPDHMKKRNS